MPKNKTFTSKTGTAELVKYAADELGVDLSDMERKEVQAYLKKEDPKLFEEKTSSAGTDEQGAEGEGLPKSVTILIHEDGDDDEFAENFVPVGFNGRMYQVQKGVEAEVPYGVFDVLNNAIEINYKQVTDQATKMKYLQEKKVKRWPFSVIKKHY